MAGVGGFTNVARNIIADALIGGTSYDKYNNSNAHLGVGDGDDAFDPTDSDLQGSSKARLAMQATYPQRADNALTFVAQAGTGDANFAWEEWAIFNHATTGQMLCRFVQDLGTKASGATWNVTAEVTIVLP